VLNWLTFLHLFLYLFIFNNTTLEQQFYHIDDDLLVKQLLGEATEEETLAVNKWKEESESNRAYYQQLKKIWDTSKALAAESNLDEMEAWERFQRLNANRASAKPVAVVRRFSWMKVAASVILLVGLALAIYLMINTGGTPKEVIAQSAQNVLIDTLSDGSIVTLNKKSSIVYPEKFKGKTRTVALKGEAFFSVTPDKKKPFVINVNDVQVTVVGTSFNIKAENGITEVVVETGIVQVTKAGRTVTLNAGEKLVIKANETAVEKEAVSDQLYNYYRTKEFVCEDTPLWKLVKVLNEAYDANIIIERKELNDLRLNTTFNNESIDKVLEIIHLTFDITVIKKDGQIILK